MNEVPIPPTLEDVNEVQPNGLVVEVDVLIRRIRSFMEHRGWSESYFCKSAAGDVGVLERLEGKKRVQLATLLRIEAFLDEHEVKK